MKTQLHIEIMRAIGAEADAAATGKSARRAAAARERARERQDFADDGRFTGEVSLPPGPRSRDEDEDEPKPRRSNGFGSSGRFPTDG